MMKIFAHYSGNYKNCDSMKFKMYRTFNNRRSIENFYIIQGNIMIVYDTWGSDD